MSTENINIGAAELEIMKVVWKAPEPIGSTAIGTAVEDKGWKRTTIATLLARLVEKGAFGSASLPGAAMTLCGGTPQQIDICGVVTDICVISNAIMLHSAFLETPVNILAD